MALDAQDRNDQILKMTLFAKPLGQVARIGFLISFLCLLTTLCGTTVSGAGAPNVLFCIADDASFPHMSAYGCSWVKTPGFDRVASSGLLFNRAYTPNAKCAPSRSCILTGRNSWQLEEAANHMPFFPWKFKSLFEALAEQGWFVGHTAKGWAPGVPGKSDGKPRQLVGPAFNARTLTPPAKGISANDYAANFADFLKAVPPGKPWCFWFGSFEPHRGYEFGSGIAKGGKRTGDIDRVPACWPDNETVRTDLLDYAFELEHFDQHVVRMLDLLESRGDLSNTLVIVTADNGMPFPRAKGQAYEVSNHLPLAIMWPAGIRQPGRRIDDFVSFIDFAPTIVELAGLNWADIGMASATGRSLTEIFLATKPGQVTSFRDHVLIGKERHDVGRPDDVGYPIRGIVKDGLLYVQNFETNRWPAGNPETGYLNCDGGPTKTEIIQSRKSPAQRHFWQESFGKRLSVELYDLRADPDCLENLAGQPGYAKQEAGLHEQLFRELRTQGDPRMDGRGEVFDRYVYSDASTRDFYNRMMRGEKLRAGWVNKSDFDPEAADPPRQGQLQP